MKDPKTVLLDLQTELGGELLEDVSVIRGREFRIRLLSEEENSWVFGHMRQNSEVSLAMSARVASLAVGIRSIEGHTVEELFTPQFGELEEVNKQKLLHENFNSMKFVCSSLLLDYLKDQPSDFVSELHEAWRTLEERKADAQGEVKNLSGEDLEKDEKKSLTESSQLGEK